MAGSDHNSKLIKCPELISVFVLVAAVFLSAAGAGGTECTSETYSQLNFDKPQKDFSAYEKIFVRIQCHELDAGEHTLYVNWVHDGIGIVRSDKQDFLIDMDGAWHSAFFWFRLSRQGPIKSALTNQDFYPGHLGDWTVEASLGETVVCSSTFSISGN